MPLPEILISVQKYLQANPVTLSKALDDGRVNSSTNEREIIDHLKVEFKIIEPAIRDWYDMALEEAGKRIYVNIKVSELMTADNVQCKLGIYLALTGLIPDFTNGIQWEQYFKRLSENLNTSQDKDYYFLVVGKSDPTDIIATSLKQLGTLVPNGNNLPFQCRWDSNRKLVSRTHEQATEFILGTFEKSIALRSQIYIQFNQYFHG